MPRALIFGGAGQDGILLSQFLLSMDYDVHCVVRVQSVAGERLPLEAPGVVVHRADLTDAQQICALVQSVSPSEVYNLAAESSVAASWKTPTRTMTTNALGTVHLLEAIRVASDAGHTMRFYHASSSEMFGRTQTVPQVETTRFEPVSPYAVSKVAAHHMVTTYREAFDLYSVCGILYNHESHYRPASFVTRKITSTVAKIKLGLESTLQLGTLDVSRDWGYAGDYVRAMWLMLQQDQAQDYIIATGVLRPLEEFVAVAFAAAGIQDWRDRVQTDLSLRRPTEVAALVGEASKAQTNLGCKPDVSFEDMIGGMVKHDLMELGG